MLENIYFISQLVAVAVAGSFVFVGIQMRQNTKAVRASTSQAHSTNYHAIISSLINSNDFPEIWNKGSIAPDSLSDVERVRFTAWLSGLRNWSLDLRRIFTMWIYGKHTETKP